MVSLGCQADSGLTLTGHAVLDGETDNSGIEVRLAGPTSAVTHSALDGSYRFANLPSGTYLVSAHADATREDTLLADADAADKAVPDFVFHPIGTLVGKVTRAGSPAGNSGIVVLAPGSSSVATSADDGVFRMAELSPGSYDLFAFSGGFLPGTARGVTVRRGETTSVPELDLTAAPSGGPQPGQLHGVAKLVGEDDASDIAVSLVGAPKSAVTGADGSFLLPNPPDGIYSLVLARDLYAETVPAVLALPDASGFYVDGSLYPLGDSTLVLPRGTRQIGGNLQSQKLSPSGDFILFLRYDDTPGNARSLYSQPVGGGAPTLIADRVSSSFFFSPDGTRVLYGTGSLAPTSDLWTAPVGGGAPLSIATSVRFFYGYAPDGGHILYSRDGSDLYVISSTGQNELRLLPGLSQYQLAPGGSDLIAMTNCQYSGSTPACDILRAPLSGAAPTVLATQRIWMVISPGFDRILYSDRTSTLYSADAHTGAAITLATNFSGYDPVFTPDGQKVVYESTGDAGAIDVNVVAATGGTPQKLTTSTPPRMFSLSTGGNIIYLTNPQAALPLGGGPEKPIATGALKTSPKGKWAYLLGDYQPASKTATLSVAPEETGEMHVVAVNVLASSIAFSPDESQIAYLVDDGHTGASGWLEIAPTAGGAPTRLVGGGRPPVSFSPQGTRLLYGVGDPAKLPTLWTVPAAGGAARALGEHSQSALFSDDNTLFSISAQVPPPFSFQRGLYRLRAD
jgi:hypothetical protein